MAMGDDKVSPSRSCGSSRELLMAGNGDDLEDPPKSGQASSSAYYSGREKGLYCGFSLRSLRRQVQICGMVEDLEV